MPIFNLHPYMYLGLAIIFEVVATTSMKYSDGFRVPLPSAITITGYCIAFFSLAQALRTIPVGLAYAIWCGLGMVLVALAGVFLFRQVLDIPSILGIGFIILGVVVMGFSSQLPH